MQENNLKQQENKIKKFKRRPYQNKKIRVMFFGGVGEIGKNMTAIEYGNDIFIIDCGSIFPNFETPGIDLIIPDFSYLVENKKRIKALIVTHGHEDHIGAISFLLEKLNKITIYASELTMALINYKLEGKNIKKPNEIIVKDGSEIKFKDYKFKFIAMNHSIEGALAFAFKTRAGYIFHTGDFKIDFTPLSNSTCDLSKISKIGDEGVLLLMSESTNVEKRGYTISEQKVIQTFREIFELNKNKRIILATFASNFHRIMETVKIANRFGKKVVFNGRSMKKIYNIFLELQLIKENELDIIEIEDMKLYKDEELCIICTGAQGEPQAALSQMVFDENSIIKVKENDLVIFSSSPIPGNEYLINQLINNVYKKGADCIYGSLSDVHVSGHACQEELKLILNLLRPKYFVPVHGEFRHQTKHMNLAKSLNIGIKNFEVVSIGDTIEINEKEIKKIPGLFESGNIYVDGSFQNKETNIIRDRKLLSKDGVLVVIINYKEKNRRIKESNIEFIQKGIELSQNEFNKMENLINTSLKRSLNIEAEKEILSRNIINKISSYLRKSLSQRPYIIPVIIKNEA